jgi:HK97 gp10 family phage protein
MEVSARVERREKFRAAIRALPEEIKEELRKVLGESAEEIAAMARRLVPVEEGDLRASIGWTFGRPPKGSLTLAQADVSDISVSVYAGNNRAFYARWVEFGTVKMRARPFFFPSYRALKRRVRGRVTRATTKAARKVAAT